MTSRHSGYLKACLLLATTSLFPATWGQDVHSRIAGKGAVLEPAHYNSDTGSASTLREDLAQHFQKDINETGFRLSQELPLISKMNRISATGGDKALRKDVTKQHWEEKNATVSSETGDSTLAIPQLELVVARTWEGLEWLSRVPSFWQVTIISKGSKEPHPFKVPRGRKWNVLNQQSISSDSEAFAHYIADRYNTLAEYTVFTPARPLQLNGRFIELLQSPTKLGLVQALSGKSAGRATNQFVTDRISTRTLNSVLTHDPTSVEHARWFSKDYNLTWGQNLVKKYFDMIGLHEWMDERQEIGSCAPQGMLGVERSRIMRHPKSIYDNLLYSIPVFGGNTFVVDRIWLMLFAGSDFRDVLT